MESRYSRYSLPVLSILSWFGVMAFSFWWFEYRHWQSFANGNVTFNGEGLSELLERLPTRFDGQGKVRVMHFTDEECACSSYSRGHIKDLQSVLIQSEQFTMTASDSIMNGILIPATPSVAVWDKQGELAYFGPYSSGAVCGEGVDFVSQVLVELERQKNPKWINMLGIGCFCPWLKVEKQNES
jgi:hypothetical protein